LIGQPYYYDESTGEIIWECPPSTTTTTAIEKSSTDDVYDGETEKQVNEEQVEQQQLLEPEIVLQQWEEPQAVAEMAATEPEEIQIQA